MLVTRPAQGADFELRQFHNQPSDSPLHKRLSEMWAAVKDETGGRVQVQTFRTNNQIPGGDPAAAQHGGQRELDFFHVEWRLHRKSCPGDECAGILFAFSQLRRRFSAPWTAISEITLREEMKTRDSTPFREDASTTDSTRLPARPSRSASVDDLQGLKNSHAEAEPETFGRSARRANFSDSFT